MTVNIFRRNRSVSVFSVFFFVSLPIVSITSFGLAQDKVNDRAAKQKTTSYYDIEEQIRERKNITRFKDALPPLDRLPVIFKVKTGEVLIEGMKKDRQINSQKNQQDSDRDHDLNTHSGRSAWVFGNLFNVDLRAQDDQRTIHKRAQKFLETYRTGVIDASKRQYDSDLSIKKLVRSFKKTDKSKKEVQVYKSGLHDVRNNYEFGISKQELIKKYRGKIQFGITDYKTANSSEDLFRKLLDEWMPIGKKLETLSEITGQKPKQMNIAGYDADYYYLFDTGAMSQSFGFNVKEGIITSVSLF